MISTLKCPSFVFRLGLEEKSIQDWIRFSNYVQNPESYQIYIGIDSHLYEDSPNSFSQSLKRIVYKKTFISTCDEDNAIISCAKIVFDEIIQRSFSTQEIKEDRNKYLNHFLQDLQKVPNSYAKIDLIKWIQTTRFKGLVHRSLHSKQMVEEAPLSNGQVLKDDWIQTTRSIGLVHRSLHSKQMVEEAPVSIGQVLKDGFVLLQDTYSPNQLLSIAVYPYLSFPKTIESIAKSDLKKAAQQVADFHDAALNHLDALAPHLSKHDRATIRNCLSIYAFRAEEVIRAKEGGEEALQAAFPKEKGLSRPSKDLATASSHLLDRNLSRLAVEIPRFS